MRWSLTLNAPDVVVAGGAFDKTRLEAGEYTLVLGVDGRTARVGVSLCGDRVVVAVLAEGRVDFGARPDHEEWYNRAHLGVLLNPGHDHATRWMYAVDDREMVIGEAHFACPGEELGDDALRELDAPPEAEGVFRYLDDHRFFARLSFPAAGLWPAVGPAGLALRVGFHEIPIPDSLCWPERVGWTRESPLVFGDVYRETPKVHVASVDVPTPTWGGAPSPVFLHCRFGQGGRHSGRVKMRLNLPTDGVCVQEDATWQVQGREGVIAVPLVFPFRAKWANGLMNVARLHLDVVDDAGALMWTGAFPFGFDTGIIVRETFGRQAGEPAPRPAPDHPDFLNAFRAYVLTRLPDYVLQTTREGAPSDFYLKDRDGKADLDLSRTDALDGAAAMLCERFPDWQDALCAVAMWVHHPCVTRHSSTWSRVSNNASIETIPRLAGCFCGDTTRLTALLADKIGQGLGVMLKGWSMGLRGHLATLVETPIGAVVIDGMLGLWFHALDNTRLATLEEMRASREIAERVWYAPRAHGHEFFFGTDNQLIRPFKSGPLQWPSGENGA